MTAVIDINTFAMVFDKNNARHRDFSSVKTWIERGDGFLVFGGTKYIAELARSFRHLRLVRLMKDAGQAIEIDGAVVDAAEEVIIANTRGTACNDQHVMALLFASRCRLLCSLDSESYPFIKNRSLYPKGACTVRIYSSPRNADLLQRCRRDAIRNRA
jgi:hypothetical protein